MEFVRCWVGKDGDFGDNSRKSVHNEASWAGVVTHLLCSEELCSERLQADLRN